MQRRRSQRSDSDTNLPALAPRASQSSAGQSSRDSRQATSSRPRSSHRSRAGCWTCRTRKVKCDEVHPRCGPCTRLSKDCDWEQRWKFDDSTRSTQEKFSNVNTSGNAVWDPAVPRSAGQPESPSVSRRDSLPSFGDLTTDEDRERKAESRAPGTYNVIVNPNSFSRMPEYASSTDQSRRTSVQSVQSSFSSQVSDAGRLVLPNDPNTVVLTRFEDAAASLPSFLASTSADRRQSLPGQFQRLDISTASPERSMRAPAPIVQDADNDEQLIRHYEQFIAPRILPASPHIHQYGLQDPIVLESRSFLPLHHAICAITLLSLHYQGIARWEDALEREGIATRSLARSLRSEEDLNSDGVLYLHFLLLVYDICNPLNDENMWYQHMQQLRRIGVNRNQALDTNTDIYWQVLGFALMLDIQAAFSGRDSRGLAAAHAAGELMPVLPPPIAPMPPSSPIHRQEVEMMVPLITFSREIMFVTTRLSQLSLRSRQDSTDPELGQQAIAAKQQAIGQFQTDLWAAWNQYYPSFLPRDDPRAGLMLSNRLRQLFETAYLFHCINIIYSSTSMFPGQAFSNPSLAGEVARHCRHILALAQTVVQTGLWGRPPLVFAVFLAGVATPEAEIKTAAIHIIQEFERNAFNKNVRRARDLLLTVCEEQRQRIIHGGRAEEVDWLQLARSRQMDMVDFGL
ncbi:hypothetical protein KVT40_008562 [Elsinoe batatas]|uniref:Zn(2)-C6 fungal-type domain-containing protein n=1 Tax=Elsinoe batatas TaxID=2601811 RepID=A0A8K0KX50_9PEZI|nr:hypothetical protein KVT40_008562 [Elsinoe batatas]